MIVYNCFAPDISVLMAPFTYATVVDAYGGGRHDDLEVE